MNAVRQNEASPVGIGAPRQAEIDALRQPAIPLPAKAGSPLAGLSVANNVCLKEAHFYDTD